MPKEHPILFSSPMIRAIQEGRKTQTRRPIIPQAEDVEGPNVLWGGRWKPIALLCPYGQVGDRLWVRETHYRFGRWNKNGLTKTGKQKWTFKALTLEVCYYDNPPEIIETKKGELGWFKRPSIFMPRWASRITGEITDIRVQRLNEISGEDAFAEGCGDIGIVPLHTAMLLTNTNTIETCHKALAQSLFNELWDSINSKRGYGWSVNPWVWCISFKASKGGG